MNWLIIKTLVAHLAADWGFQTGTQAARKQTDPAIRLGHCGVVALSIFVALLTGGAKPGWALRVAVWNGATHFVVDSFPLPKWADQAVHLGLAVWGVR